MDASAREELESIKWVLNSAISELESISASVRHDFKGIGSERCSEAIDIVINYYYQARNRLNNLDTSTVTDSYAQSHSSGGGVRG